MLQIMCEFSSHRPQNLAGKFVRWLQLWPMHIGNVVAGVREKCAISLGKRVLCVSLHSEEAA